MPGKLLNLTFHQPGFLTGEDLRGRAGSGVSGTCVERGDPQTRSFTEGWCLPQRL
jgi:hypothetical protein